MHKVTGYTDVDHHARVDDDGDDGSVEEYKHSSKWRNGKWGRYPLFIIIIGGYVIFVAI
jgi:hypothetical protein